ncbi:5-formyltetrahydrofolate cyclo-ligase [Alicyclobacillus hesperidum URH17-3-68]|uniref:5-formyltetrahydrofolate cyclo-ligase n=1 Tax=Alicyclobacillus hesperidum TaxID=89784 RepID=A0A1H2ULM1_9BACL|nr:5-formyltetrahydrofolate cyclo-ligase [Alicyclobacillus hesperidum]EJY54869.1 5-formyltetrahydrofolate cyclo-ligase [Alicyclobacillus hesperidum URH17-3-68]GLV14396.1 5-formyltetrahydrofolate cyclo-ligase [Alicyclobacillus hesperidum]SDW56384.1 5-formyltetrahydrofolate cyclo-ligase [Alicyclobacillus hesperidum]
MSGDKTALRKSFRRVRLAIAGEERTRKEREAALLAVALAEREAKGRGCVVAMYAATSGELNLADAHTWLSAKGYCLAYPRVRDDGDMAFSVVRTMDDLVPGRYGILAPRDDAPTVPREEITLAFVPGLAFAKDGVRLGYGGGYYDRYFADAEQQFPVRVGVCFSEQFVDCLPFDPHDVRMHAVLTDGGVFDCGRSTL